MTQSISLAALRTFVEVARLESFKDAAVSLGVTPGAVSQHVKLIEMRFEVALFDRSSRTVKLTHQGACLMQAIHAPFQQINATVQEFHDRRGRRNVVRVLSDPSFAASWLVPRLGRFLDGHPDLDVKIDTSAPRADGEGGFFDIAIRYDRDVGEGVEATRLMTPRFVAVGSPALLARYPPIKAPRDCLALPLLQDRERGAWTAWFRAHRVDAAQTVASKGASFADDGLLLTAAAASQGLALVQDVHAEEALARHVVRLACRWSLDTSKSYYLVTLSGTPRRRAADCFRAWLLDEIASRSRPPLIAST